MNSKIRVLVFAIAVVGMGISMPSCPGQDAMQKQIDSLTQSNADLKRQVAAMDTTVKSTATDMGQAKQLLEQMTNAIQAQKTSVMNLETSIKDVQTQMTAIQAAGYKPGRDIYLALDSAASEFTDGEGSYKFEGKKISSKELVAVYSQWAQSYPIISIEDGLSEHDWNGWGLITQALGDRCQLVGDDLFVTNPIFLKKGIEQKVCNSILIKLNQIGTVTETLETMKMAAQAGYTQIASHRSGETEDTFIAELAVGTDCGQIKTGSASRTDRIAKYNQLLRIEEQLGSAGTFAGLQAFPRLQAR